jgi:protein phosphatase
LTTDYTQIIKDSLDVEVEAFDKLLGNATKLICAEKGRTSNFSVIGRLVKLNPRGRALIIGDLHGDLESLIEIFKKSDFLKQLDQTKDSTMIFLGDYGDRGAYSTEVYYVLLQLKLLYPGQIVLMRGNHEGPDNLIPDPHDLPDQFQRRFGDKWTAAYRKIRKLFTCMYNAVLVEERYLMIHGGPSLEAHKLEDLAYAHNAQPNQDLFADMLWSDPSNSIGETSASPRGVGKLFSADVTDRVLERFQVRILIRGHEPCPEGFKIDHRGRVLTLFSRKGPPYFNEYGAYLEVDLTGKPENAEQLMPYIHRF